MISSLPWLLLGLYVQRLNAFGSFALGMVGMEDGPLRGGAGVQMVKPRDRGE